LPFILGIIIVVKGLILTLRLVKLLDFYKLTVMKTIKLFFFLIISSFISVNAFAQDEFYNNSQKENTTVVNNVDSNAVNEDDLENYSTESDYENTINQNEEVNNEDERQFAEEEKRKRQRRNRAEFAAEVFFDVIVNTAFIIVAFWH
jgi:hypothetical protein